jgi:hypothetical protein
MAVQSQHLGVSPEPVSEQWWRPGDGLALFVSFGVGIVAVVVAVALIEAVDGWWILAPVMALVFTLAALVTAGIMLLLADDGDVGASEPGTVGEKTRADTR